MSSSSWPRTASASPSRSTGPRSCRTSSASSRTARAATTSSRRRSRRCWRGIGRGPIGARVTLTRQTLDVTRIYRHLADEIGFWEVGFAPVTTAPAARLRDQRRRLRRAARAVPALAAEYRDAALAEPASRLLERARDARRRSIRAMRKAYPCGAGLGLMGVATDGDVALCHRFAGSDAHKFGDGARRRRAGSGSRRFSTRTTSTTRPIAGPAGRGRSAPAAAITRRNTRYGSTERAEPALLRVDSRLDAHVPRDLRRDRGEEPGVPASVRSDEAERG